MSNILTFGDSVMKGIIFKEGRYKVSDNRFTNLIERETGVKIINKSRMGHTINKLEKTLMYSTDYLNDPNNSFILLEYGGNDCDFDWKSISDNPDEFHPSNTELSLFRKQYTKNIEYLKSIGKKVYLLTLPPIDPVKYTAWISKGKNASNILHWLEGDPGFLKDWHEIYNLEVIKIAHMNGIEAFDITSPFLAKKNMTKYLCEDGIHPNDEGHKLIAQELLHHIENML